jgi:2-polyprenyl-3-methyl-5-hydroxy-6-metoxy-1,4-benzoquinol methylase
MPNEQSEINKKAWTYRAYEWWNLKSGSPEDAAHHMKQNPQKYLKKHLAYMGEVKGKKIINLLGSNGRKAIPLALLGADVTVVDISAENQRFALELAREANVPLTYIVSDILDLDIEHMKSTYDVVYLEGGILHYFSDLGQLTKIIFELLKFGGRLVLNDFHPIRKVIKSYDNKSFILEGDYFHSELFYGDVAYKGQFPSSEQVEFPDCLLRYWNMGEIVSSVAASGLVIEQLIEEPRTDSNHFLPGSFTLIANKYKIK